MSSGSRSGVPRHPVAPSRLSSGGTLGCPVWAALLTGSIFYHYVEGWSWVDAFYFCTITLARPTGTPFAMP